AMVAYHSVLVFNVLGWSGFKRFELPDKLSAEQREELPTPIVNLFEAYRYLSQANFTEYYHDALQAREEVLNLFNLGYCTLEQRSLAERLFFSLCSKVLDITRSLEYVPEEFQS